MEKSVQKNNDILKLLLTIFIIISFALGGFVIYDKMLKKENKSIGDGEKTECNCQLSTNEENKCPPFTVPSNDLEKNGGNGVIKASSISVFTLNKNNQEICFNGQNYKIRNDANDVRGFLYINDIPIISRHGENGNQDVYAKKVYVTDELIIFTQSYYSNCGEEIVYIMKKLDNGNLIDVSFEDNDYAISDLVIKNNELYAKGALKNACRQDNYTLDDVQLNYQSYIVNISKIN